MFFLFMSQPDFSCNPYALWKYITENTDHETAWLVKKDERYFALKKRGIQCAIYNTWAGKRLAERADIVIMNSYTFGGLNKLENQLYVNLWHGSGIKAHDYFERDMDPKRAYSLDNFAEKTDLMCLHSLDDRFRLSSMLHMDLRKCVVTGQPRLDCVKSSDGVEKLKQLYGAEIENYRKFIFFAPSFRANMSSHAGTIFSDNIFRLDDYDNDKLDEFLKEENAALIYKLHPIEQTAFSGRKFEMSNGVYSLTEELLIEKDVHYDELLSAFDVMVSDYSSIVFDYLLLNRPVVYLIPDYEEYKSQKGFVFNNVDDYMPGDKAHAFDEMLKAIKNGFDNPDQYREERERVLRYRFDYTDDRSSERCYQAIMNYKPLEIYVEPEKNRSVKKQLLSTPSSTDLLRPYFSEKYKLIDSTKPIPFEFEVDEILGDQSHKYLYISEENPTELRKLSGRSSTEIDDIEYYYHILNVDDVKKCYIHGGVDTSHFNMDINNDKTNEKTRIGFAGVLDNRIYFSMVQCMCEVYSDCEIIFAGELKGALPIWFKGFDNLKFIETSYEDLPNMICSFDVAILPFYGRHANTCPSEYFQYLACGKQVVASNMSQLPNCKALYIGHSVDEVIKNISFALKFKDDKEIMREARNKALEYDWKEQARNLL